MSWSRAGIFFSGLLAACFLCGEIRYWQMKTFYFDRLWLDEVFSSSAQDAIENSLSYVEKTEDKRNLNPEVIWERFLTACSLCLGGKTKSSWEAKIGAAFLTCGKGYYPYEKESGWGDLIIWQEDHAAQISEWLSNCLFPFDKKEEWARTLPEYGLVVLYQEENAFTPEGSYYRVAVGGARYRRSRSYEVTKRKGTKVYHREGCLLATGKKERYSSMEECAESGAWACEFCIGGEK